MGVKRQFGNPATARTSIHARSQLGMTLIEVMAAGALLAIAIVSLAGLLGHALSTTQATRLYTDAANLAQERIERLQALPAEDLDAGGNLDQTVTGYYETIDVENDKRDDFLVTWTIVDDVPMDEMKKITVQCIPLSTPSGMDSTRRRLRISTLVARGDA